MPRHKQVTTCLKSGGALSNRCSCHHCTLGVCSVCGAYEGSLTTDCPGTKVDFDRQKEVYETSLDYTDDRGWHLNKTMQHRSPRFEDTKITPGPPPIDQRARIAPSVDWILVDRYDHFLRELGQRAFAWVIADRTTENNSARCTRLEDEIEARDGHDPDARSVELHNELHTATTEFHLANEHSEKCDDEFRQAARRLVAALEDQVP
jgi:hypothetical protein